MTFLSAPVDNSIVPLTPRLIDELTEPRYTLRAGIPGPVVPADVPFARNVARVVQDVFVTGAS